MVRQQRLLCNQSAPETLRFTDIIDSAEWLSPREDAAPELLIIAAIMHQADQVAPHLNRIRTDAITSSILRALATIGLGHLRAMGVVDRVALSRQLCAAGAQVDPVTRRTIDQFGEHYLRPGVLEWAIDQLNERQEVGP